MSGIVKELSAILVDTIIFLLFCSSFDDKKAVSSSS
jgi:hypothetical protein